MPPVARAGRLAIWVSEAGVRLYSAGQPGMAQVEQVVRNGKRGLKILDRHAPGMRWSAPFQSKGGIAMRPGRVPPLTLTRRALGTRLAGAAVAMGFGNGAAASPMANPVPDPDLRDAALRGLALAGHRGDPVTAAAARAAMERLSETDPEGAVLARLYQLLDVRPAQYVPENLRPAAVADLATLHAAIRACQPVTFGYTDLSGNQTARTVLPLALVHPPQGLKLLAWCAEREAFRQFFVRAMRELTPQPGDFSEDRLALLQGLLEKEAGRA